MVLLPRLFISNFYQKNLAQKSLMPQTIILVTISIFCLTGAGGIKLSESYLGKIQSQYGEYAKRRLSSWLKLMNDNRNIEERKKLEVVNTFFNLLEYQTDYDHWGVKDYWATPVEFLVSGAGDCEDFSIAKYFTLLELGVPDEKLLITYAKYSGVDSYDQAHMVLTYYSTPSSIPLVLDNIVGEILPADKRNDLKPIYSFNGAGLWRSKQLSKGKKLGQASELNLWADMKKRMESGDIGEFK